jgi:hypothetical protein
MNIDYTERKTNQIDRNIVSQMEELCEGGTMIILSGKLDEATELLRPPRFQQVRMGLRDAVDWFSCE